MINLTTVVSVNLFVGRQKVLCDKASNELTPDKQILLGLQHTHTNTHSHTHLHVGMHATRFFVVFWVVLQLAVTPTADGGIWEHGRMSSKQTQVHANE